MLVVWADFLDIGRFEREDLYLQPHPPNCSATSGATRLRQSADHHGFLVLAILANLVNNTKIRLRVNALYMKQDNSACCKAGTSKKAMKNKSENAVFTIHGPIPFRRKVIR
jgi:hypothetical protein